MAERWVVSPLANAAWRAGQLEITTAGAVVKLATDHVDVLRVVHAFARPRTVEDVIDELSMWPSEQVTGCISELVEAGVLELAARQRPMSGYEWDIYSLAFHRSTRAAGFQPRQGAPTRAIAARQSERRIPLRQPTGVTGRDLAELLDARRSWRSWPARKISFDAFSGLLWLSARNRAVLDEGTPDERVSRPYPSGGGAYTLELYPVIGPNAVELIDPGVYRYLPEEHGLEPVSGDRADYQPFLTAGGRSAGSTTPPVVIVVTSRFARQAETYGTLAYSLVLKEVGALYQTLYLVAEYLNLAPCALGGGSPDEILARLCEVSEFAEPVVGEFLIGPR